MITTERVSRDRWQYKKYTNKESRDYIVYKMHPYICFIEMLSLENSVGCTLYTIIIMIPISLVCILFVLPSVLTCSMLIFILVNMYTTTLVGVEDLIFFYLVDQVICSRPPSPPPPIHPFDSKGIKILHNSMTCGRELRCDSVYQLIILSN